MKLISIAIIAELIFKVINTIFMYPALPDPIVSHGNAAGQADGYLSKFRGISLITLIMAGLALFLIIPRTNPLKKNL